MRWTFAAAPDELAHKDATLAKIDAWWRAFAARAPDLEALFKREAEWDLPAWMSEHLAVIDPNLMWEYGPGAAGGRRRLVITPESARHLRPLVTTILERAPRVEGWEFYGARLADTYEGILATVEGRSGCDVRDWRARAKRKGIDVELTFVRPWSATLRDDEAFYAACVSAESILGEDIVERWIGAIDTETPGFFRKLFGRAKSDGLALADVRAAVEREIDAIRAELPDTTRARHLDLATSPAAVYRAEAPAREDYAGRSDVVVATELIRGLFEAVLRPAFFSTSFSKVGERFCYLKVDTKDQHGDFGAPELVALFESVDEALRAEDVGCAVGRAFGHRYRYVDVAVTDVEKAIDVLRRALRARPVPTRSWLAFHDCDLAAEWLGIHEDTPPPPSVEEPG